MMLRLQLIIGQFSRHPFQALLNVFGIALGVCVVLAIDLANSSAERAFQLSADEVSGGITHVLTADRSGIDETVYAGLRTGAGVRRAYPLVEGWVRPGAGQRVRLLGIDPFAAPGGTRSGSADTAGLPGLASLLEPGSVIVSGWQDGPAPGDALQVSTAGRVSTLQVIRSPARVETRLTGSTGPLLIADISTAQDVLGMHGRLSRVDLALDSGEAARLATSLAYPLRLSPAKASGNAMEQMTRAFRVNLQALSLLALLIGAFLIFNTMMISVLQRRAQISTLRTLGLTRAELVSIFAAEIFLLAAVGTLAGCLLGTSLGRVLLGLVSRTLEDLYFIDRVRDVYLGHASYLKAVILGLAMAAAAGLFPLLEALRMAPEIARSRSTLERTTKRRQRFFLPAALACAIAAGASVAVGDSIQSGFMTLAFTVLACALLIPLFMVLVLPVCGRVLAYLTGPFGLIAGRNVLASLSRTQVAVTALAIAISATVGVSIMIGSFRLSVQSWLDDVLQADVYLSARDMAGPDGISPELVQAIRQNPGVQRVTAGFWTELQRDGVPVELVVRDLQPQDFSMYRFIDNPDPLSHVLFFTADYVLISEPFAYRHQLAGGDRIELAGPGGSRPFTVAGIFRDYSSDRGIISMHADVYRRYWPDYRVDSLSVYLENGIRESSFIADLNNGLLAQTGISAVPNRGLREMSMQVFDRTFTITEVLRLIAVIIAIAGILGALATLQLERGREFALMRSIGMTPAESFRLVWLESGLIGAIAGVTAVPLGMVMAGILIFIINRRSFGWSMEFTVSPAYLAGAVLLGLVAGLLAGTWPAWRQARQLPAVVLRDE